jgi:hypothetical protein
MVSKKDKTKQISEEFRPVHDQTESQETEILTINLDPAALRTLRSENDVKDNTVRTSKYTWWSFLPHNLFEQFTKKMANLYFLVIMCLQMVPVISISNG